MSSERNLPIQKKLIVGIGYEKCGTTTAHDVLSKSHLIAAPNKKETVFFNRDFDKGIDYYLSLYSFNETTQFLLDITPSYHLSKHAYARINRCAPDHLVLLFVRDPIRRAFSLYWHNIINHYSKGETALVSRQGLFSAPFQQTFQDVVSEFNNYCIDLNRSVGRVMQSFGSENTMLIYFDEVIDGSFVNKIETKLGCSLGITGTERWSNRRFPIKYELVSEDGAETLVLKRANTVWRSWPIELIGWTTACRIVASTQHWTRYVTKSDYEAIYNKFYKDMDLNEVGLDRDRLFQFGDILHV